MSLPRTKKAKLLEQRNIIIKDGLSFDDVLLEPKCGIVNSRKEVDLTCRLTKNIKLNIPIVGANMDTITEHKMAIQLAKLGGIGFLHRYCSIEEQVEMVKRVKQHTISMVQKPIVVHKNDCMQIIQTKRLKSGINSYIVVDCNNKFEGIITNRDFKIYEELLTIDEYKNKEYCVKDFFTDVSNCIVCEFDNIEDANENLNLNEAKQILISNRIEKLPIIDKNKKIIGLLTMKVLEDKEHNMVNASVDKQGRLLVGAAIGVKDDYITRAHELVNAGVDVLLLDIAHGHSIMAEKAIRIIKTKFPNVDLIAGNVCTREGVRFLADCSVDGIKVGVGGGSICLTRVVTGFGVSQCTAVMECTEEAKKYRIPIIGDGAHCGKIGNIVKDLVFADTVMLGGFLSGTDETPGEILVKNNQRVKMIRGMAGLGANLSKAKRLNQNIDVSKIVPEGIEGFVPYKGPVENIIFKICGGIRSGMSYLGVSSLQEAKSADVTLIKISQSGQRESGAHDINLF
jgi:IMP dehydrogenase